jgi:16S rRNA (uracil1498-N3)-methyltransferase
MPPRFYCPALSGTPTLDGDELHHLHQVRRLGLGDQVELFDGRGGLALCTVAALGKRSAAFQVVRASVAAPPERRLTIATAVPKGPRMDTLVEKVTELGVAAIWPITAERSSVSDCGAEKQRGWQRRAVEACKQSGLLWLPEISEPQTLAEAVAAIKGSHFDLVLVADPSPEATPVLAVLAAGKAAAAIIAFVGPEGGFTDAERAALLAAGAAPVRLTPTILRIETAAIALAAAVAFSS